MDKVAAKRPLKEEGSPPLIRERAVALRTFEEILRRGRSFYQDHGTAKGHPEFIELLLSHKVEFLLVGGYALAFHGAPRFTEDIDFLVRTAAENAERIEAVLEEFGFGQVGITRHDFLKPEQVIQLGRAPHRIDLPLSAALPGARHGLPGKRWILAVWNYSFSHEICSFKTREQAGALRT